MKRWSADGEEEWCDDKREATTGREGGGARADRDRNRRAGGGGAKGKRWSVMVMPRGYERRHEVAAKNAERRRDVATGAFRKEC